jgi:signal transduction histidine kinase
MSLRFRLALAIASVAALVTAGVGLVVFDRERSDRINRARLSAAIIVEAEARIQNRSEFRPDLAIEGGGAPDDPRIPDELRRRVAEGRTAHVLADVDGETFVIAGTPLSRQTGERIYHFRSFESEEAALAGLRLTLLRVGIAATALGGLMGVLVASILARPLVRSAALARRLAAGDLDARLNLRGSDEVAELGRALDDMAEALGTKIRELDEAAAREQRFSADVAHELRTPITGIVAASSLLDDSPAATMVRQRARTMASLVEDLLEVMRLESVRPDDVRRDTFDLVRLVADVVAQRAPDAVLEAPDSVPVVSDPRRLERIVANLLDNAVRHGTPPVHVTVGADGTVTVRDHGPGFGDFLDRAGDRFAMADGARSGGTGLGLAITRGQAAVLGGELLLRDDGGAVATLRLPVTQS